MSPSAVYALQRLLRLFRAEARRVFDHHFRQSNDGIERRAQLVADAGDELRLVLTRHLQLAALVLDLTEQSRVLDRQHRLGREGLKSSDSFGGECAWLTPQDDEAAEYPLFPDKRDCQERAQALSDEEGPGLRRDELPLVAAVADLHALPHPTS